MPIRVLLVALLLCLPALPQLHVDRRNLYERVWAVVPLVGSGTADDPVRPKYAPVPPPANAQAPAIPPAVAGTIFAYMRC